MRCSRWRCRPLISILAYLLSYHRYRRLLLEGKPGTPPPGAAGSASASWLLERWMPDPRQQAAFAFIWKTLARSRTHRLILLAYAGIASARSPKARSTCRGPRCAIRACTA